MRRCLETNCSALQLVHPRSSKTSSIKHGFLRRQTRSVAVMVYVFSGRDPNIAAEFLAFKARSSDCDMEASRSIVQGAYVQLPAPSIAATWLVQNVGYARSDVELHFILELSILPPLYN